MTDKNATYIRTNLDDSGLSLNLNDLKPKKITLQYPPILEFEGKEYKIADILDGLAAVAQQGRENAGENMTVAQLRERLKQGDNNAQILVNDLVSELPNQITDWITEDSARYYVGDDLTDLQFNEFWYWMRHEWGLVESKDEIRLALEQWMDDNPDWVK